jgi:hypothetical protein
MLLGEKARSDLRKLATAYMKASGLQLSTVSRYATGNSRFYANMDEGVATFSVDTYDRIVSWFAENCPRGFKWPVDVARPTKAQRTKVLAAVAA